MMNYSSAKKKEQIELLIGKKPQYEDILRFYEKILELQATTSPQIYLKLPGSGKTVTDIMEREGFPLIARNEFVIDIESSSALFESLCNMAKNANDKMKDTVQRLEDAFSVNAFRREDILRHYADDTYIDSVARDFDLDKSILKFLIHVSIYPSLHSNAEMLMDQVNLKEWLRGYCPICGSPPSMSQFNSEGQRSYLCSFCGFEWPGERLKCPFCDNTDHTKLHYFYAEGDEAYRVELCDNCSHYIKTVDSRKLDYQPALDLEDIVTIHLDILASEKGYKRVGASPWAV